MKSLRWSKLRERGESSLTKSNQRENLIKRISERRRLRQSNFGITRTI